MAISPTVTGPPKAIGWCDILVQKELGPRQRVYILLATCMPREYFQSVEQAVAFCAALSVRDGRRYTFAPSLNGGSAVSTELDALGITVETITKT